MRISLVFALLVSACDGQGETPVSSPEDKPVVVVAPKPPPPPTDPRYDLTFATADGVAAWQAQVTAALDARAAMPPLTEATKWLGVLKPDLSYRSNWPEGHDEWTAPASYPVATPPAKMEGASAAEAKRLEEANEKWPAARMYLDLGDVAGAKRCAAKLSAEGSNIAAAQVSVRTGDMALLDASVDTLVAARYFTKLREEVIDYAVSYGKLDVAMRIAKRAGWDVSNEVSADAIRAAALAGQTTLLVDRIEEELGQWESGQFSDEGYGVWAPNLTEDIAVLSRKDRAKATAFFKRFLALPSANVVAYVRCGEGCGASPMTGTYELLRLVKGNATAHAQYLERTRQWLRENGACKDDDAPEQRYIAGESEGYCGYLPLEIAEIARVKTAGDASLTKVWSDASAYVDDAFNRELVRSALGLPVNAAAEGLSPSDRYLLAWIAGKPLPDVSGFGYGEVTVYDGGSEYDHTLSGCYRDEQGNSLGCLLTRMGGLGVPDLPKLKAAAKDLGIVPSKDDGLRVAAADVEATVKTIQRLGRSDEACTLYIRLVRAGFDQDLYACDGHAGDVDIAFLVADRDPSRLAHLVTNRARARMREVLAERATATVNVIDLLRAPSAALDQNVDARNAPNVNDVPLPAPASEDEANALVALVLPTVRDRDPESFRAFVVEAADHGNSAFYDAEVARLTAKNDLAALSALTRARVASR